MRRYGKKQGRNEKDLIKEIHYIVLLISSERKEQNNPSNPINIHGEEIKDWKTTIGQTYHPDYEAHRRKQQTTIGKLKT